MTKKKSDAGTCPHCGIYYRFLPPHFASCSKLPKKDKLRQFLESNPNLSMRKVADRYGVGYKFFLNQLNRMGMSEYITNKTYGKEATCEKCGRTFKKIDLHRTICNKIPPAEKIVKILDEEGISVFALSHRIGVSPSSMASHLNHLGLGHYIGRKIKKAKYNEDIKKAGETQDKCISCGIKVFEEPPLMWVNVDVLKVGDRCAWCARIGL